MFTTKHCMTARLQQLVHWHSSVTYMVNTYVFVFRWPCFLSSTYCFGHTCNVSADKVEVTFISCRTRNHVESLDVKLHLLYISVTYFLLVTNILPSTDILFEIQIYFGQENLFRCSTYLDWMISKVCHISKPPVDGLHDTAKVQSFNWSCFCV